ncbi:MAG TPA: hypothetical protein ENN81_09155, partial [Phycisphaerales bacterium]|nr:hypothetical protein [Phycisphaerales bacterium]
MMKSTSGMARLLTMVLCLVVATAVVGGQGDAIPLPEHPRPDFERADWVNLNGPWNFGFDPDNKGLDEQWFAGGKR